MNKSTAAHIAKGLASLVILGFEPKVIRFDTGNFAVEVSHRHIKAFPMRLTLVDGNTISGSLATNVSLNRVRGVAIRSDGSYFLATQKGGDIWWVDHTTKRIHLFVNGASSGNSQPTDGMPRLGEADRIAILIDD